MQKTGNLLLVERRDDDTYTIRMTPQLQDEAGEVAYAKFTDSDAVETDDEILIIESSKTVMEIASPITGKVIERNTAAEDKPDLLNSTEPSDNWLLKLTDVDEASFNALEEA